MILDPRRFDLCARCHVRPCVPWCMDRSTQKATAEERRALEHMHRALDVRHVDLIRDTTFIPRRSSTPSDDAPTNPRTN